jgi:hypothetical protein
VKLQPKNQKQNVTEKFRFFTFISSFSSSYPSCIALSHEIIFFYIFTKNRKSFVLKEASSFHFISAKNGTKKENCLKKYDAMKGTKKKPKTLFFHFIPLSILLQHIKIGDKLRVKFFAWIKV